MSALTDVSNIIAAIKTDILTALANRGATVSQATKLSEVSGLINNMVVQGSGDNIPATNMTGASIAVGDKVFLQENVAVEQTVTTLSYTSTNDKHLLCSLGTKVLYGKVSYDITSQTTSSISDNPSSLVMAGNYPIYNSRGGMHVGYCLTTDGCENIAKLYAQDDYIVHWFSSGTSFTLSKVNENLEPIQSWTVSSIYSSNLSIYAIVVIGDKLYVTHKTSNYKYVGTIDESSSTITLSNRTDDFKVLYSTIDNKFAIASYGCNANTGYFTSLNLVSIDANNNLIGTYISKNSLLVFLLGCGNNYISFNRYTGVLCLSNANDTTQYGIFKYNTITQDFDTISITISELPTQTFRYITVSNDMSYLVYGNKLYKLEQTVGGYKAVSYNRNLGSELLTGFATSAASHGETFYVNTVLGD